MLMLLKWLLLLLIKEESSKVVKIYFAGGPINYMNKAGTSPAGDIRERAWQRIAKARLLSYHYSHVVRLVIRIIKEHDQ